MPFRLFRRRATAFTLVELLVVIGIIALLISILLPALNAALASARTTACLANLRSVGQALQLYVSQYKGYIPGPNTSGSELTRQGNAYVFSDHAEEPTFNTDWVSPLLGSPLGLPTDRSQRMAALVDHKFRCPENEAIYGSSGTMPGPPLGFEPTQVRTVSYVSPIAFHVVHPGAAGPDQMGMPPEVHSLVEIPVNYAPKVTSVGRSAEKIFALDGTRFVDRSAGGAEVQFHRPVKQVKGGNFLDAGPCITLNGSPYYRTASGLHSSAKLHGYRHKSRLNAVFFDGHAETLDERQTRQASLCFPTGSIVKDASATEDQTDSNGMIVP